MIRFVAETEWVIFSPGIIHHSLATFGSVKFQNFTLDNALLLRHWLFLMSITTLAASKSMNSLRELTEVTYIRLFYACKISCLYATKPVLNHNSGKTGGGHVFVSPWPTKKLLHQVTSLSQVGKADYKLSHRNEHSSITDVIWCPPFSRQWSLEKETSLVFR